MTETIENEIPARATTPAGSPSGDFAAGERNGPTTLDEALAPDMPGDFAAGERTELMPSEEELEASHQGDFAAGERNLPTTLDEALAPDVHGDFAAGERTSVLTEEAAEPGTFGDKNG